MDPLKLDITVKEERMQEGAMKIIKEVKPSWDPDKICFVLFTDGLTNKLIGGYQESEKNDMVLVRVNGPKTEQIIDRNFECDAMKFLHREGLASKVYAQFNNGLAYEFFPGVSFDSKSVRDPKIYPLVCDSVAKMHSLTGPKNVVDNLYLYLKHMTTSFPEPERQTRFNNEIGSKEQIELNAKELRECLSRTAYPMVFSHNDIALENIIYNKSLNAVRLIDFEYTGYSYQPFDIANHFMKCAAAADVNHESYLTKDFQLTWIKEYLTRYQYYTEPGTEDEVTDKQVGDFQIACEKFIAASYFYSSLWALAQVNKSSNEFDYFDYAIRQMNKYKKNKAKLV